MKKLLAIIAIILFAAHPFYVNAMLKKRSTCKKIALQLLWLQELYTQTHIKTKCLFYKKQHANRVLQALWTIHSQRSIDQ